MRGPVDYADKISMVSTHLQQVTGEQSSLYTRAIRYDPRSEPSFDRPHRSEPWNRAGNDEMPAKKVGER